MSTPENQKSDENNHPLASGDQNGSQSTKAATAESATVAPTDHHYDLMIIGTGSGNMMPGPEFGDASIALVEKGAFGGTCLNVGCIPTKMYVYAAEIAHAAKDSARYGVRASFNGVDWPSIVSRVFDKRIDPISQGGENYRRGSECPTIDVFDRHSYFVGPKTLRTGQGDEEMTISADRVIIAAGARPFIPEVISSSGVRFYTNEDILRMPELPSSMIILGGGVIAAEFAHVFAAFGVAVTVINRSPRLLKALDTDVSDRYTEIAQSNYDVHLGRTVTEAREDGDTVSLALDDGTEVSADVLLVALGRTPNGDELHAEKTGATLDERGRIRVNEFGETAAPGVWALGDVSSAYQLKHVANHEARVVKHNVVVDMSTNSDIANVPTVEETIKADASMMGHIDTDPDSSTYGKQSFHHTFVPAGVFGHPHIATVGMTESEARDWAADNNTEIAVKIQNYGDVAYGWAMEDTTGFAKLIADAHTGKLLGAHLIGPQATTLIHQFITMMENDLDVRTVGHGQYWIHPALSELNENALLGLELS